jgi:hypothetical protein
MSKITDEELQDGIKKLGKDKSFDVEQKKRDEEKRKRQAELDAVKKAMEAAAKAAGDKIDD